MEKVANVVSIHGELQNEVYAGDRVNITRNNSMQAYRNLQNKENTIDLKADREFIKFYIDATEALANEDLNGMEYKICIKMLRYMQFGSGLLAFDNGRHLRKEHILGIVNRNVKENKEVTFRTVEKGVESLVDKKIFAKTRVGNEVKFYINPFIFMKGQRINKTLYSMFQNSKWAKL